MQYDNPSKTLLVLKGTINHPKMAPYIKALGIVRTDEQEVALFNYRQQQEAFTVASATENPRGRPTDVRSNFLRAAAMSIAPNDDSTDVLSKSKRASQSQIRIQIRIQRMKSSECKVMYVKYTSIISSNNRRLSSRSTIISRI